MTRIGLSGLLLLALCTGPARAGALEEALRPELPTGVELVAVEVDRGVLRLFQQHRFGRGRLRVLPARTGPGRPAPPHPTAIFPVNAARA